MTARPERNPADLDAWERLYDAACAGNMEGWERD